MLSDPVTFFSQKLENKSHYRNFIESIEKRVKICFKVEGKLVFKPDNK